VAAGSFHDTDTPNYTAEDFRFTTKGDVLYAIGLAWPANGKAVISSPAQTAGSEGCELVFCLAAKPNCASSTGPTACTCSYPRSSPLNLRMHFASRFERGSNKGSRQI
jgi:hypothetical protein